MSLGLFQDFMDEYIKGFRLASLSVGLRVPSWGLPLSRSPIGGTDCRFLMRGTRFESYGQPIFDSRFMKFVFRISKEHPSHFISFSFPSLFAENKTETSCLPGAFSILSNFQLT